MKKLLTPKLKKREHTLADYMEKRGASAGGEDLDPTLTLNPVMEARMHLDREAGLGKRRKREVGGWRHGALKKLGLRVGEKSDKKKVKVGLQNFDTLLRKENLVEK